VAGFHIEYTGMKFGLFYAGELLHALTFGRFSALFLGGWRGPGVEPTPSWACSTCSQGFLLYFVIMWVKYSMPRIRIDQMLSFCLEVPDPAGAGAGDRDRHPGKLLEGIRRRIPGCAGDSCWLNLVIAWGRYRSAKYARMERRRVGEPRPVARAPRSAGGREILFRTGVS
jgi:hypothetical protein